MRYQDFIAELGKYLLEAQRLKTSGVTDRDPAFRTWRHGTESLVREAAAHGYRLPGAYSSSSRFYTDPYHASAQSEIAALAKDVGDSEIELRFLIEQYEKYGVPPLTNQAQPSAPTTGPAVPDRVTLSWLFHNVSVGVWAAAIGAAVVIFLFGVGVGRTEWYAAFEVWLRSVLGN